MKILGYYLSGLLLVTGLSLATGVRAVETTNATHFNVSYKSNVEPLPLNRIHSWVLHVATRDGKPVEKATISVYGGMPAHRHGLPTQPEVSEIGGGDYLVQGLKFSMMGKWEMWFNIRAGDVTDKVKFDIEF
ncbi:MAG: FixH family protein [Gammaproteobacteria bacterium]|nr:FixH family protein [Gammaproteobacteria bacterium]